MKTFVLGAVTGVVVFLLGVALFLRLGFMETRGDLSPSNFENSFMTAAVHASVRRHAPDMPNPVAPTDDNLIAGGKIFMSDCSGCHGNLQGSGDDSDVLFPRIPQLHKVGTAYTEAQVFWIAKHGIRRAGCSLMENGVPTKISGPWLLTSAVSRVCLRRSKKPWRSHRRSKGEHAGTGRGSDLRHAARGLPVALGPRDAALLSERNLRAHDCFRPALRVSRGKAPTRDGIDHCWVVVGDCGAYRYTC